MVASSGLFRFTEGDYDFLQAEGGKYLAVLDGVGQHPNFDGYTPEFRGALEAHTVAVFDTEEDQGYIHRDLSSEAKTQLVENMFDEFPGKGDYGTDSFNPRKASSEKCGDSSWRSIVALLWEEMRDQEVKEMPPEVRDTATRHFYTEPVGGGRSYSFDSTDGWDWE